MTEESAVKVCVRVRPLIAREESAASENTEPIQLFWRADKKSIYQVDDGNPTKTFSFDRVFTADETTNHLYQDIAKPLVVSTVEGYNGTIFAYGQTSSGKTFTMMGSDRIPGVIPLAVEDVFQTIKSIPKKEFLLRVSYMEIYNETVTDLLVDSWKRKPLEVREQINKNIYVADLTEELVTSPAQALAWIRKGEKNRHYGKTKMNQRSSRSHTIFRMILESRETSDPASGENADGAIIVSHLNLVDLAGSERASQTGAEGARFKEGCNINRSLFTLGQVIKKLTDEGQKGFTNYRDSKLTRILQNSLGGNAKTVIICTITPVTLDETLSTLQFASTAKKMKNDPHVTECSDDGALLKRYRNEIVDLKRRLQEVSSVTQTTATEKKVLSQLLQEKDHLQREQEDRIRNLTKLLVTSSNLVPVQKMPKRRVTWGGKMLRLARPSAFGGVSSDLSFAESFARKRKGDRSCLELGEDDEDFDSHWEIPDEPSDEMEMSHSSVAVRSFEDSPKDFLSPDRLHELSGKVSNLELQLDMESQQKEEAMTKVEALNGRVADLELQAQQKQEAMERLQTTEERVTELELQLQTEAQQKQEAMEKGEMLEFRVADLEKWLEETRSEFAETVQLCETLASEKDTVAVERDYLKQELGMFIEQTKSLEKEKADLSQELEKKREMDEFTSLEKEFGKEREDDLQNEISSLKMAIKASEEQCLQLQQKIETQSEELKKKTEFAEEFQSMSGKDLVQEVAKLRRSLDDAEGLSRDTKKDWAVLRSQNITLEETNVTLAANHEKMTAEVNSLRSQLEAEKARYRKMQVDLQKELNIAFEENTKLNTLLDGKVPQNLIDSMELERRVASLTKELAASHEAEEALRAQLEKLASFQALPDKIDNLMKQVCELTEELCAVQADRDSLLSTQTQHQEEAQQLKSSLQTSHDEILSIQAGLDAAFLREKELNQQYADVTQQLDSLRVKSQAIATIEERSLKLEVSEQHRVSLEESLSELQQQVKDLDEKLANSEAARTTEEEISLELQEQLNQLTEELQSVRADNEQNACAHSSADEMEKQLSTLTSVTAERDQLKVDLQENVQMMQSLSHELQCVRDEKDALLMATGQRSAEEMDSLLSTMASLTAERDQLKVDLQENVEMMIENQEELRTALEKNREQKVQIRQLEAAQTSTHDGLPNEMNAQLEELQAHTKTVTEELESVQAERDSLLTEKMAVTQTHSEEMEKLLSRVTSLSEERDQLQEILEGLRQEKKQLRAELEDKMEMVAQAQSGFNQPEMTSELQERDEKVAQLHQEVEQLQTTLQRVSEQKSQLEGELQRNVEMATETQNLHDSLRQQLQEQNQRNADLERLSQERQAQLEQQITETQCLLHSLQNDLQEQKQKNSHHMEVCEQRESDLEQQTKTLSDQLESARAERDALLLEKESSCETSTEEMEKLLSRVTSLSEERDQLQEILEGLRQEKKQLRAELEDKMEMVAQAQSGFNQPEMTSELQARDEKVAQLHQEVEQLQTTLQRVSEQKSQLEGELQRNVEMATETQNLHDSLQQQLQEQNQRNADLERLSQERQAQLEQQITETQCLLHSLQNDLQEQKQKNSHHMEVCEQRESDLEQQTKTLSDQLESARAERDALLLEKESSCETSTEEMEKLLSRVTSLSEERDQLQEILEGLRQEKKQLRAELEDKMEMMQQSNSESQSLKEDQEAQQLQQIQQLQEHLEETKEEMSQLKRDLQENVEVMIENQEELRVSQEKIRLLQDEIGLLKTENADLQAKQGNGSDAESALLLQELQKQIERLSEELESVKAERDGLFSERSADAQTHSEEMEKLLSRVTSLSEERDQLQEILEGLRQEKKQLRAELEDKNERLQTEASAAQELLQSVQEELHGQKQMNCDLEKQSQERECSLDQQIRTVTEKLESLEAERDNLLSEKEASCQTSREEMEKLLSRVTSLSEERDQLQEILEGLRQEKKQLRAELEDKMEILQTEIRTLTEKLESLEAERDSLLSDKESSCETSTEEMQTLLSRVTSLSEERDQLQETLEGLRQEKKQLRAELEDKMEMISVTQQKLNEQEHLSMQQQAEREERDTKLQQEVQRLKEEQTYKERQIHAEADTAQQLLSEANTTIAKLREQLSKLDESSSGDKESASSLLQDSTGQLQESFRRFHHFIDTCSKYNSAALDKALKVQGPLKHSDLTSLPKPTMNAYRAVCQLEPKTVQSLGNIMEHLQSRAQDYRVLFEELVKEDLAVFEERRLQDVLLCRMDAPSYSVKDTDFHTLWKHRLAELLDKRQLYLQRMVSILEKLYANMASYPSELSAEISERERFKEQLQAVVTSLPINFSTMDHILNSELERRSEVANGRRRILQGIIDEQNGPWEELKLLATQAHSQLQEERSKTSTLLQALEGAALKTELSLLKDNQQLGLQLQQTQEKVKALCMQIEQLQDAQVKANNRVSNHKQATQLLQTELQDSRAQVEEMDDTIKSLKNKLRASEASPSATELEKLQTKLFKMEMELSSATDKHQQQIQRMTIVLNEKEDALRKLKEALRKSQQQGEESFLQGEELHARLTNPRGVMIKSSILLEKTKLEEEVKRLQLKITELESQVSSQQAETGKWKSRAIKLKGKNKAEVDKPSPPCTPTKRGLPMISESSTFYSSPKKFLITPKKVLDSPRKILESPRKLDSPNVPLLVSPKSRFFDVDGGSDLLSRTRPKQFFDNSSLGTIPDTTVGADGKEWWPQSPKQEDMCKTQ